MGSEKSAIGLAMAGVVAATVAVAIWATVELVRPESAPILEHDAGGAAEIWGATRERPVLADRPGTGAHSLAGTIVDASGAPVASAQVTAELELGPGVRGMPPGGSGVSPTDDGDRARLARGRHPDAGGLDLTPVIVAISREDGAFELRGLDPGRYHLRVEGEGIVTAEVRFVDVPSSHPASRAQRRHWWGRPPNPPASQIRLVVAREVALVGRVVDQAGAPVGGIDVRLDSDSGQPQRTARADESGGFKYTGLSEGVYRVWAYREAEAARAVRVERLGPGPFEPVTLTLEPAAIVVGRAIDAQTAAGLPASISLIADDSDEPTRHGESGPDGVFRIPGVPPGRWTAQAASPGYLPAEAVSFTPGTDYTPVLSLTRGGVLAGVVVDVDGNPVQGAVVSARGKDAGGRSREYSELVMVAQVQTSRATGSATPIAPGGVAPGTRFIPRGELGVVIGPIPFPPPAGSAALRVAVPIGGGDGPGPPQVAPAHPSLASRFATDAAGGFRLTGIEPGTYQLIASHRDYADAVTPDVALGLGETRSDLRIELSPGVWVYGRVTDDRGGVVPGAILTAQAPRSATVSIHTVTGLDGTYSVGPFSSDVTLVVSAIGYGAAEATIQIAELPRQRQEREQNFVLGRASSRLAGRVVDAGGFPVRFATIIVDARTAGVPTRVATTDDSGQYTVEMVAEGDYSVTVDHLDYPKAQASVGTSRPADVTVAFGGGVDVTVRDRHTRNVLAGARVDAVGPTKLRADSLTRTDGAATLGRLAAGAWKVTASAGGYVNETRDVEVPAGTRPGAITVRNVIIELERGATLAGVIRNDDGQRVGGAIVSAGGQTGRTDENGAFRLVDVRSGDVTLTGKKGDREGELDVTVRPGDELVTLELTIK